MNACEMNACETQTQPYRKYVKVTLINHCAGFPVEKALPLWFDKQSQKLRACAALNPVGRCAWFTTHRPWKVNLEEPKFLVLPFYIFYFQSSTRRLELQQRNLSYIIKSLDLFRAGLKPNGHAIQF
eukprot:s777_g2.t1